MTKITLTDLVNLENQTSVVNAINANNAILETAFDNTLSRDGTAPNTMSANLDLNSNRIINLPTAISTSEPVTLSQMTSALANGGTINTGFTNVPVSAVMQPVVNSSTLTAAQALFGISTAMQPVVASSTISAAKTLLGVQPAGVSSIAGNIGAFTLSTGLANTVNALSVNLSSLSNALGADIALTNTSSYFDGASVAQGTTGTWLVIATATFLDTSVQANFSVKLYDGTTTLASAATSTSGANFTDAITLCGIITNPVGNLRIAVKGGAGTTGVIKFNSSGLSKDCTITAIRIA